MGTRATGEHAVNPKPKQNINKTKTADSDEGSCCSTSTLRIHHFITIKPTENRYRFGVTEDTIPNPVVAVRSELTSEPKQTANINNNANDE
jgi:hypothetical protein